MRAHLTRLTTELQAVLFACVAETTWQQLGLNDTFGRMPHEVHAPGAGALLNCTETLSRFLQQPHRLQAPHAYAVPCQLLAAQYADVSSQSAVTAFRHLWRRLLCRVRCVPRASSGTAQAVLRQSAGAS